MNESIRTHHNEQREAAIVEARRKQLPKWNRFITWSKSEKRLRLGNVVWMRGSGAGYGAPDNYDAKLSFAFEVKPRLPIIGVIWENSCDRIQVWLCLIPCVPFRLHYQRAYGGRFS